MMTFLKDKEVISDQPICLKSEFHFLIKQYYIRKETIPKDHNQAR